MTRPPTVRRLAQLLVLSLVAAACTADRSGEARAEAAGEWRGRELPRPLPRPDFTFLDTDGEPFDFRAETAGHPTLLFFGYTHCPDVCPVHLSNVAAVVRDLPGEAARRLKVVFVTTDPVRDTSERIRRWLGDIHPAFIGLRGPLDEVHAVEESLMLPRSVVETPVHGAADGDPPPGAAAGKTGEDYFVGHASAVVAFSADGPARVVYPWGTRQKDWRSDLPRLIAGGGAGEGR